MQCACNFAAVRFRWTTVLLGAIQCTAHSGVKSNAVQLLVFTSFCCQQRLLPIAHQCNCCTEVKSYPVQITEAPNSALQSSTIKPWQVQVQCSQQRVFPDVLLEDKLGQFSISVRDELNHFKGKKLFSFFFFQFVISVRSSLHYDAPQKKLHPSTFFFSHFHLCQHQCN